MIKQQIILLQPIFSELIEKNSPLIEDCITDIEKIINISKKFGENWLGSWATIKDNHYTDFTYKDGRVIKLSDEQIKSYLQKQTKLKFDILSRRINSIVKESAKFKEKLITELSVIKELDNLLPEKEILNLIETHNWGIKSFEYIKKKRPSKLYLDNPRILNKGIRTPPHISVEGELMEMFTTIVSVRTFYKNSKRLLRQLYLNSNKSITKIDETTELTHLYKIIENFHIVCNQLKKRYNKRDTLIINDEYDVQDLFHALLKINYSDVRPEEYTPSYAGSSNRMDFLLKKEKTIIEIKKTRDGLKDKNIGDQLILDTKHYRAHPDCKHLICFVYDPDNKIINPRGLENDLNEISNEDFIVEVYIRP